MVIDGLDKKQLDKVTVLADRLVIIFHFLRSTIETTAIQRTHAISNSKKSIGKV